MWWREMGLSLLGRYKFGEPNGAWWRGKSQEEGVGVTEEKVGYVVCITGRVDSIGLEDMARENTEVGRSFAWSTCLGYQKQDNR